MERGLDVEAMVEALGGAGFPDAGEDVREMLAAAGDDPDLLACWLSRRLDGEPLAWLTGTTIFLGNRILVHPGVYVPRSETELIGRRAIDRLPEGGIAADLATGSGALAVAMRNARPSARVVATDIDRTACRCAADNGVEVYQGDLGAPLPGDLAGRLDVVVAVVPYVPADEMDFLPRDVRHHEPRLALDGGLGGMEVLAGAVRWGARLVHPGGALLVELGGHQDRSIIPLLEESGMEMTDRLLDGDGDLRGIEAVRPAP